MRNFVFSFLILTLGLSSLFFCWKPKNSKFSLALELEPQTAEQTDISIFIRKPTYSVFYNNKIYFLDDADNLLKSYNTQSHAFDSKYLDLSSYKIIDVSFVKNYLYIFTTDNTSNYVNRINLDTLLIDTDFGETVEKEYTTFFATEITFETKDYTLVTLSAPHQTPKLILFDETSKDSEQINIKFDASHSSVIDNIKKTIVYQAADEKVHLVFVYNKEIAHFSVNSISNLKNLALDDTVVSTMKNTAIPDDLLDMNELMIKNVGLAKIDNKDMIAIAFSTSNNAQHVKFYSFDFEDYSQTIKYETSSTCQNSEWINFNNEFYSYVNTEHQKLFLTEIYIDNSGSSPIYAQNTSEVDNPAYEITYFSKEEFVYKESTMLTELYDDPWGAKSVIRIGGNTDIIKIGEAKIIETDDTISDYDYCLFTSDNRNYTGFVKNSCLTLKTTLTPKEAGYKEIGGKCIVTVWPNTSLYTLPTTIAGVIGKDGSTLLSQRITTIEDNSPVQVIDVLCNYYANNIKMIKVIVNDSQIGYIDANCVRNPSDVRDFVITNATIKNDGTTVYLSPSVDSTVLSFKLDAGKNVRINGKRNTKTGFTSITFNDEYGNEYSGYIETDYIKSDSWSTLQIVGCVLIAINIGLLILILIYRNKHLGNRGQKIEKES